MDIEEFANMEWTLKMNAEQFTVVKSVFETFQEEHGHEAEAAEFVQTLKNLMIERTR